MTKSEGLASMVNMDNQAKERLKGLKRTVCPVCHRKQNYYNPVALCFGCKKKYCFDHISCGYTRENQPEGEELHDICDNCLKQGGWTKY